MASSDDEVEAVPNIVSDYKFVKGADEESISFANLPLYWGEGEIPDGKQKQIYLSGKTDDGLRLIYIQVTAWKFVLPKEEPEIYVLSVQGNWIKLQKPWKPFSDIIRTLLVTLHVLHFAKWNPLRPQRALWDTLNKTLRFEKGPCVDDVADHVPLITEAIKWDEQLAKSKLLGSFLAEKPWEKKTLSEDVKPPFIVDDVDEKEVGWEPVKIDEIECRDYEEGEEADESTDSDSEEGDCFDSVCAICDNGGNLYICDGKCMRSFHATVEGGDDSKCDSLGLTAAELEAIKNVPFICDNCKYKKHQCFACGKLGSSDELSNPEVFCCANGACGYFYHPHCVARLLHPGCNAKSEELQNRIAAGEPFACPIHKCHVCKELEVRSIHDLQFAVCRRCPKAYHRKCLPSEIAFDDDDDDGDDDDYGDGFIQRAWEGLIPNRILIYCLDHEIDEDLCTPPRDHIVFPGPRQEKRKMLELEANKNKNLSKGRVLASEYVAGNKFSGKEQKSNDKVLSISKGGGQSRKRLDEIPTCSSFKKQKLAATRNSREKLKESVTEGGLSSGYRSYAAFCSTDSEPVNSCIVGTRHVETEITKKVNPTANRTDTTWTLEADARRRVLTLMKHAASSVTLEEVKERHKPPSTHKLYSRFAADQVTFGKVQGSIQAVRAALKKLDGGSVQDAKAVCGDELLEQVLKWKDKLKVFLAPFLYGMRYTSFGRHFTKMDKLKEIVELLHCYVQDGDMLVDFCCGSNDFSCLMKKKLDEMGKICSFKNYDILQAKNDFNFERRDWMGVKKGELPDGSKLIMGLNPPFGVNAALANKFINKALEFRPKLLILIVPRETQRLDEKSPPYDLIWDDDQMLSGKSFYLPGSVDAYDKQIEDWNVNAPVLYLWSNPAWTIKHRAIADEHGHKSGALKNRTLDESHNELLTPNLLALEFENKPSTRGEARHAGTPNNLEQKSKEIISHREGLPCDTNAVKNHSESSSKNSGGKGSKKRPPSNSVLKDNSSSKLSVSRHGSLDVDIHSETPARVHYGRGDRQLNVGSQTERLETSPQVHYGRGDYRQLNQSNSPTFQPHSRTEHDGADRMNDSVSYQTQHVENPRQGRSERGDYHHHQQQQQQQFNQSNISTHQFYSPTECNDNDNMINVVNKYIEGPRGATGIHAYNPRLNPDQGFGAASDRRMRSPMHEGYESIRSGQRMMQQPIPDFGRQMGGSPYGRVQSDQGTAYPPPYTESRYGQRSMVGISSYEGGLNTPVTQRYASRLDEMGADHHVYGHPNHGPMMGGRVHADQGPMVGRVPHPGAPQPPSLRFAPGPFHPHYSHHNSSGWLQE